MITVSVQLPALQPIAYDVRISAGLLTQLGAIARQVAPAPSCGIVSDSIVAKHYLTAATRSLEQAGYRVIPYVFPAGEANKTITTAVGGLDTFLNARVERATPIIALGGGVVGDLAGFVAATLLRGVPFIQVPTTLLAAVDASVGGKVGVDHAAGKNLIGAFHQPRAVVTDIATFATMPTRELRCGLAECIKHGVIRDARLCEFIRMNAAKILAADSESLAELVAWNVRIKAAIVQEDPFEHGVRALLNLGHTFGHAIEKVTHYGDVQHGEGVALGTVAACRLAYQLGRLSMENVQAVTDLMQQVGLPVTLPGLPVDETMAAMWTDKKVQASKLRFVIPTALGAAEVVGDVPVEKVRHVVASLLEAPEKFQPE